MAEKNNAGEHAKSRLYEKSGAGAAKKPNKNFVKKLLGKLSKKDVNGTR